jgi:hypothetical protein
MAPTQATIKQQRAPAPSPEPVATNSSQQQQQEREADELRKFLLSTEVTNAEFSAVIAQKEVFVGDLVLTKSEHYQALARRFSQV